MSLTKVCCPQRQRLSSELIVDEVNVTRGEPERLHVEVGLGLDDVVGIEAARTITTSSPTRLE